MAGEKKVVVLGAGFAGLWLARSLLREGFRVQLLEQAARPGGLMQTIPHEGFLFDLGPHILLAPHLHHYREVLGADVLRTDGYYGFGFRGKQIPSPLTPGNLIRTLGPGTAVPFAASMLWQKLPFVGPRPPWTSVDPILTHRFGQRVNEAFFRSYIPKITGLPPQQVSPDWFLERYRFYQEHSLGRKLRQKAGRMLARLFSRRPAGREAAGLELYYPRQGAQMLTDALHAQVAAAGASVHLGTRVTGLDTRGNRVVAALCQGPEGAPLRAEGDFFVSTLPVDHLPGLFGGALGEPAADAARALSWRHLRLLYLAVDRERVSDKIQIYFTEGRMPFKRIYEPRNLIPSMGRPGTTGLCVELCTFDGDETDRADETALVEAVKGPLCSFYGLAREEVRFLFSRRVRHAYAVYREGYRDALTALSAALLPWDNVVSYGRQGSFRYNHLVDRIIDASEAVTAYLADPGEGKGRHLGAPDPKSDFF